MVMRGIEIKETDPPSPDLAIPKRIIAGTTVRQNTKLISKKITNKNSSRDFKHLNLYIIIIPGEIVCNL